MNDLRSIPYYYEVAVAAQLFKNYTYAYHELLEVGTRVIVPFRFQRCPGVIVRPLEGFTGEFKVKSIEGLLDDALSLSKELFGLAKWMSHYYAYPLGEVLECMLPSPALSAPASSAATPSRATTRSKSKSTPPPEDVQPIPSLTPHQQEAFDQLFQGGFPGKLTRPFLLQGITGSGKTLIYLHMIQHLFASTTNTEEPQVLLLVPEIALTPQLMRVLTLHINPEKIQTLHSGINPKQRREIYTNLKSGKTQLIVGARSSVFAPFCNLKLIIVDEEHDSSYKQDAKLRYHGRDVAIMRAKLEGAFVLMGSATPSLESYYNATTGKYQWIVLKERAVAGAVLPKIHVIEPKKQSRGVAFDNLMTAQEGLQVDHAFEQILSQETLAALKANFERGEQSIVLINRRGFSYFLFDTQLQKPFQCSNCDLSMTLHKKFLKCHHCQKEVSIGWIAKQKGRFIAIGHGSEKIEDYLRLVLPQEIVITRLDSDVKKSVLQKTLEDFRKEKIHLLVGTQLLTKGHDFPRVTLIVLLGVDSALNFPDFRAGERVFQFIVQSAGRSGRGKNAGNVLLESFKADHNVIQLALAQEYETFAKKELLFRKAHFFPPFSRIVSFEFSSVSKAGLLKFCRDLDGKLQRAMEEKPEMIKGLSIVGPFTPGLALLNKRHRAGLLVTGASPPRVHECLEWVNGLISQLPSGIRRTIDVDPLSLS